MTSLRLYIPIDAAALAVGAEDVADAIQSAAARHKVAVEIVRNGSRGLYWLEPMVELDTPAGRVAYGPITPSDADGLLTALLGNGAHALRLGPTEEIPWLKRQTQLTFARCGIVDPRSLDDYRAHGGYRVLRARSQPARRKPLRKFFNRDCAAAAAPDFRPASNGAPWRKRLDRKSISCATPMKATAARLPIA